jgi:hypothetical protein
MAVIFMRHHVGVAAHECARENTHMPQIFSVGARSIFVNTIAWIGIALALLSVASPWVRTAAGSSWPTVPVPEGWMQLLDNHFVWITAGGALASLATLIAAVGLLLRLNWARVAFIGILALAILGNLAGLWLQHEVVQTVVTHALTSSALPAQTSNALGGLAVVSRILGALMSLGTCLFLVWIILRLKSGPVLQEFV